MATSSCGRNAPTIQISVCVPTNSVMLVTHIGQDTLSIFLSPILLSAPLPAGRVLTLLRNNQPPKRTLAKLDTMAIPTTVPRLVWSLKDHTSPKQTTRIAEVINPRPLKTVAKKRLLKPRKEAAKSVWRVMIAIHTATDPVTITSAGEWNKLPPTR